MNDAILQIINNTFPNSDIVRVWYPTGGVSAQVTAVEVKLAGDSIEKIIVRQHPTAKKEFTLLKKLHALGLPVQKPYTYDDSLSLPSAPYIILEYVVGNAQFLPQNMPDFLQKSVSTSTNIHKVDWLQVHYLEQQIMHLDCQPFDNLSARILNLLKNINFVAQNESVLLHGDYWIGNLLWHNDDIVAVIDWEDAAIGDPLYDLSNARFEMLWAFGEAAMNQFTVYYQAQMPHLNYDLLPYYDLYATLKTAPHIDEYADWSAYGRDDITPDLIRERYRWFVSDTLRNVPNP